MPGWVTSSPSWSHSPSRVMRSRGSFQPAGMPPGAAGLGGRRHGKAAAQNVTAPSGSGHWL